MTDKLNLVFSGRINLKHLLTNIENFESPEMFVYVFRSFLVHVVAVL